MTAVIGAIAAFILWFAVKWFGHGAGFLDKVPRTEKDHDLKGKELCIEYKDAVGRTTLRTLHIYRVGYTRAHNRVLIGWCMKRDKVRTFRVDRILSVIDDDGVVHDPSEFF